VSERRAGLEKINAEADPAKGYPDFSPSLTRDDVYGILHATTNVDDQKAINALIEREDQMEREPGTPSSIGESNQTETESGRQ